MVAPKQIAVIFIFCQCKE